MAKKELVIVRVPGHDAQNDEGFEKINQALNQVDEDYIFIIIPDWTVDSLQFEYPKNSNLSDDELLILSEKVK